jgi:autotransporter adhesin
MRFSSIAILLAAAIYRTAAQLFTETLTVEGLTATGVTVLATGATVTFTPGFTTATVSVGPGTTVTLTTSVAGTQSSNRIATSSRSATAASNAYFPPPLRRSE